MIIKQGCVLNRSSQGAAEKREKIMDIILV
jgi:hypothetical protein